MRVSMWRHVSSETPGGRKKGIQHHAAKMKVAARAIATRAPPSACHAASGRDASTPIAFRSAQRRKPS
jgi:hypothetical protein